MYFSPDSLPNANNSRAARAHTAFILFEAAMFKGNGLLDVCLLVGPFYLLPILVHA